MLRQWTKDATVRLQKCSRNTVGSLKRVAEEPTQDPGRDGPREVRLPCLSEIPCDSSSQATSTGGFVVLLGWSRRSERHRWLLEGSKVKEDVEFRRFTAGQAGLGFHMPTVAPKLPVAPC